MQNVRSMETFVSKIRRTKSVWLKLHTRIMHTGYTCLIYMTVENVTILNKKAFMEYKKNKRSSSDS